MAATVPERRAATARASVSCPDRELPPRGVDLAGRAPPASGRPGDFKATSKGARAWPTPAPPPPTAPASTPAPRTARRGEHPAHGARRRPGRPAAGRRPPPTSCGRRRSAPAATPPRSLPRGARLRLVDLDGDACGGAAAAPRRPPRRAPQRGRHGEGAVAGLPRAGLRCCCPTWAGCSPPSLADTGGGHDALCGTSNRLDNERRYGRGAAHGPQPSGARPARRGAGQARARRARHRRPTSTCSRRSASRPTASVRLRPGASHPGADGRRCGPSMPLIVSSWQRAPPARPPARPTRHARSASPPGGARRRRPTTRSGTSTPGGAGGRSRTPRTELRGAGAAR